jgi:hypothetical protein
MIEDRPVNPIAPWKILFGVFVVLVLFLGLYPFPQNRHPSPRGMHCLVNLKQTMVAQLMYATDHGERLPPCQTWMDATSPYTKGEAIFHSPDLKDATEDQYGFAMNVQMSLIQIEKDANPAESPVLFDSLLLVRNACSGFYGFPDPKDRLAHVAYLDGHTTVLKERKD